MTVRQRRVILLRGVSENMTTPAHTSIDRTVREITPNQRETIEDLIGSDLAPDQRLFILAYNPGVEPSQSAKASARSRIHELLSEARDNVKKLGVTESEAEAAVEEAIRSIEE